jgi:hypothetical protein
MAPSGAKRPLGGSDEGRGLARCCGDWPTLFRSQAERRLMVTRLLTLRSSRRDELTQELQKWPILLASVFRARTGGPYVTRNDDRGKRARLSDVRNRMVWRDTKRRILAGDM